MGGSHSKKEEESPLLNDVEGSYLDIPDVLQKRYYLPPDEREKRRSIPFRTSGKGETDLTADTFDYLLSLPNPDSEASDPDSAEEEDKHEGCLKICSKWFQTIKEEQITWEDGLDIWEGFCTFGTESKYEHFCNPQRMVLATNWKKVEDKLYNKASNRHADPEDIFIEIDESVKKNPGSRSLPKTEWNRVLLRSVVEVLYQKAGLQLKINLSNNQKFVLIRIRAQVQQLEKVAAQTKYSLQLAWEVDPGEEFWNGTDGWNNGIEELKEDNKELTVEQARSSLDIMYSAGKLPASELTLSQFDVGARLKYKIHALERIADKVPVTNRYPAYYGYDPSFRHLYQTYLGGRGMTLFKPKDRIRLTHEVINRYFNTEVMVHSGVANIIPLHDASRGDVTTIGNLSRRWVNPLVTNRAKIGAPMVSMRAMDDSERPPFILTLFSQPLDEIKDYFGEKLGLYFSWLGFYTLMMGLLALVCTGIFYYLSSRNMPQDPQQLQPWMVLLVVFITIWTSLHSLLWEKEEQKIAVKWGTTNFEEEEEARPQFQGERKLNLINNKFEKHYPEKERKKWQMLSNCIILVFIAALLGFIVFIYELEEDFNERGYWWGNNVCSLILAVQIQVLSFGYMKVVDYLNDLENYRTQTDFDDGKIFKTFLFQIFNNYASLAYTAFVKKHVSGCTSTCIGDIRSLMITIFVTQYFMNFVELGKPFIMLKFRKMQEKAEIANAKKQKHELEKKDKKLNKSLGTHFVNSDTSDMLFEQELSLEPFEGTFDDYAEIVLQYGLICLFVLSFPVAPLLALVQNLMEIRVDAMKYCRLSQRPDPVAAEDIGTWATMLNAIGWASVPFNAAIICFTTSALDGYSLLEKWLFFLVLDHGLLALKWCAHYLIGPECSELNDVVARQKFIIQKYFSGVSDEVEMADIKPAAGMVDIDDPSFIIEKSKKIKPKEFENMKIKQQALRDFSSSIEKLKVQLYEAYDQEVFNKETGIAETKTGIPLGCLTVILKQISGFENEEMIKLDVDIKPVRHTKRDILPKQSHSDWFTTVNHVAEFITGLVYVQFKMAPIGTKDAEVVFTLKKHCDETKSDEIMGIAKVYLHTLEDQISHEMDLPILEQTGIHWNDTGMVLKVNLQFMYSKVLPIRQRISELQAQKRELEQSMFDTGEEKEEYMVRSQSFLQREAKRKDKGGRQSYKSQTETYKDDESKVEESTIKKSKRSRVFSKLKKKASTGSERSESSSSSKGSKKKSKKKRS